MENGGARHTCLVCTTALRRERVRRFPGCHCRVIRYHPACMETCLTTAPRDRPTRCPWCRCRVTLPVVEPADGEEVPIAVIRRTYGTPVIRYTAPVRVRSMQQMENGVKLCMCLVIVFSVLAVLAWVFASDHHR